MWVQMLRKRMALELEEELALVLVEVLEMPKVEGLVLDLAAKLVWGWAVLLAVLLEDASVVEWAILLGVELALLLGAESVGVLGVESVLLWAAWLELNLVLEWAAGSQRLVGELSAHLSVVWGLAG